MTTSLASLQDDIMFQQVSCSFGQETSGHPPFLYLAQANMEISPQPTDSLVTLGLHFRLIDIREDYESSRHPIVSDYRLPFSRFDISELKVPHDAKLLVVCEQGSRSLKIAELLRQKGWKNAFSLHGGLEQFWQDNEDTALAS